ncbi:MAG: efflux RND transporter permease subunit [Gemmatimonadaceae bacterium]|nr:efflux RND transporter permease subunit [Gemmatimonadaceae bacterium]
MWISDFAIRRPLITIVSMLVLVVFGLVSYFQLKTDEFPEVTPPIVVTTIVYPGASPDQVEREILEPVEEAIQGISGVDKVFGDARDGFASITTFFLYSKDLQEATQEIRDAIALKRNDLPDEMKEPVIQKLNPTDRPIVQVSLSSATLTAPQLTLIADPGITRELRSIAGVAKVEVAGGVKREMMVQLRPEALQSYNVSVGEVLVALQQQNLAVPVGNLEGTLDERTIRLKGRLDDAQDFTNIAVAQRNGTLIRLGQLADVKDGTEEQRTLALLDGRESVGLLITKSKGFSTTEVSAKVQAALDRVKERLPAGVAMTLVNDSGERVENSVNNVTSTIIEGAILTVLVVFLFLNSWRSTVITGLALPVSVLASFIAVLAFGFTLNTMSLLGLSLAIGILIDDAIVVRENIVRHVEMGKDHYTAAREGTAEIGLAVAATTFSIVAVFFPIGFLNGEAGQWFKPFALTIVCSVLVSLFVSFSLDPMLSAYWPDPHKAEHEKWWITKQLDRFNRWFDGLAHRYRSVIAWALDHRLAMSVLAIGAFLSAFELPANGIIGFAISFGGVLLAAWAAARQRWYANPVRIAGFAVGILLPFFTFGALGTVMERAVGKERATELLAVGKLGSTFFPGEDNGVVFIKVETPPGSNLDYMRLKVAEMQRLVKQYPEVRFSLATIGGASGAVDEANILVRLLKKTERAKQGLRTAEELELLMRRDASTIGGARIAVTTNDFQGDQKQVQLQFRGRDGKALLDYANRILPKIEQVKGAVDVSLSSKGQKPELTVQVDRGLAGSLGITVGQVAQSLRPAFAGVEAGDWVDPMGETRKVRLRFAPEYRERVADLANLPILVPGRNGASSSTIPLSQVAQVQQGLGPAIINHRDRDKLVTLGANTAGRPLSEVVRDIEAVIAADPLPAGVRLTQGGETESQNEVFGQILIALGVAIMMMYLILVVQFGSFLDPIAILVSLPLSMIGVFGALVIAGSTINLMSLIGVILLCGIVAKNAILLIDFAKWSREERGTRLREALIEAGAIRLRPILMTTFALVAGMIPVALGSGEGASFRKPLGIAVIGGVITSTLLTLLVIPTVYEVLDGFRLRMSRLLGFKAPQTAEHPIPTGITPTPVAGD